MIRHIPHQSGQLREIRSFIKRNRRNITSSKKDLLNQILPSVSIHLDENYLDLENIFDKCNKYILEIGFGMGEYLSSMAKLYKKTGFIGCEVFLGGIVSVLDKINNENISNIRLFQNDANILIDRLPSSSIDQVYILFPDPWPKKRHHKRRLIQKKFLDKIERILHPEGRLIIATDHTDYAKHILYQLISHDNFSSVADAASNWSIFPNNWIKTKYQLKAEKQNISSFYFEFSKC